MSALGLLDVVPIWVGLAHHTALPPLDLFADVRVLLAEAPSYPWFAVSLLIVVLVRAALLAAVVASLRPDRGNPAPRGEAVGVSRVSPSPHDHPWWRPPRAAVVGALRFYGLALPLALVAGALGFASVAAVYAWFLWIGVGVATIALVGLGPVPWPRGEQAGRRRLRVLVYLFGLLVISFISAVGNTAIRVALVWASVGLTVAAACWLSGSVRWHVPRIPRRAPAGAATLALLAGTSLAGGLLPEQPGGTEVSTTTAARRSLAEGPWAGPSPDGRSPLPDGARQPGTLLVVPGIGGSSGTATMFRFDPAAIGFDCQNTAYFSYAGPGDGAHQRQAACPITSGAPYREADTRRPLDQLAGWFRELLADLEPPVVVVAHSQGAWVAAAALAGEAAPPVAIDAVVLIGAFPGHERGYVLDGTGAGVVGTDALEAIMAGLRGVGATSFHPRAELPRALLGTPGAVRDLLRGLARETRVVNITAALDVPVMAEGWRLPGALNPCPVPVDHGGLPTSGHTQRQIRRALAGEQGNCRGWQQWPTRAFTAFGIP